MIVNVPDCPSVGKFELKSDNGNIYWKPSDATAVEALEKSAVKVIPSREPTLPASKSEYASYLHDSPCYYVDCGSDTYMLTNLAIGNALGGVEIPGNGWYSSEDEALRYPSILFPGILSDLYTTSQEFLETIVNSMSNPPVVFACNISDSEEFFGCKVVDGIAMPCSFAEADRGFLFTDDNELYVITKDGVKPFYTNDESISTLYYNVWGYATAISNITTDISASSFNGALVYNPISKKIEISKSLDIVKDSCEFTTEAGEWYHFADIPDYSTMTISIISAGGTTKLKLTHDCMFLYDNYLEGVENTILNFVEIHRNPNTGATYINVGITGGGVGVKIELHESTPGSGNVPASLVSGTISPESSSPTSTTKIDVPCVQYRSDGLVVKDLYFMGRNTKDAYKLVSVGTNSPSSYPRRVGIFYLDTTNKKLYVSVGISSVNDWVALN